MREIIYERFGKKYRKLGRNEVIKEGAMQSWDHGELQLIFTTNTIGNIPKHFSNERDFYNPIENNKKSTFETLSNNIETYTEILGNKISPESLEKMTFKQVYDKLSNMGVEINIDSIHKKYIEDEMKRRK